MQIAIAGLGRMGMNMARRLLKGGHDVVAYNRTKERTMEIEKEGAKGAYELKDAVNALSRPRVLWMMLPAGAAVDEHVMIFKDLLSEGDILIDGGNCFYRDAIKRAEQLKEKGVHFVDAGVSGGIWGLTEGYCLMIGGEERIFRHIESLLKTLAPENGYLYCGPSGAGHFVKMVHNGIEYGMMESYGEGFDLLKSSIYSNHLNPERIARLWNRGSVIRSWLLELAEKAFSEDPELSGIEGYVEDSGEGRWSVMEAVESAVPAPVIALSLFQRFRSRRSESFSDKVIAALRREFGGHKVVLTEKKLNQ